MTRAFLWLVLALLAGCSAENLGTTPLAVEYRWGNAEFQALRTPLSDEPPGRTADELSLRFVVPSLPEDPAILITGSRTYDRGSVAGRPFPRPAGGWGLLPLGDDDAGKSVELVFRSKRMIRPRKIAIVSEHDAPVAVIREDLALFVVGAMLSLSGVFMLATGIGRRRRSAYPWMGLFSVSLGLTFVAEAHWLTGALGLHGDTSWTLHAFFTFLYPLGFMGFVRRTFGDGRLFRWSVRGLAALLPVVVGLHLFGLVDIDAARRSFYPLVIGVLGVTCVSLFPRARKGDYAARTFLVGSCAMVAISMPDMLWGMGVQIIPINLGPFGALAFTFTMGLIIERRYVEQATGLAASRRDLETLNEELRRQVERRSRELREVLAQHPRSIGPAPLAVGDLVDQRYRVHERIGSGAMGAVYRVQRTTDDRSFALKVMLGAADPARFAGEAEIAAQVRHPNIVSVVDVGVAPQGFLYLVMDLVHGPSLEDVRAKFGDAKWATAVLAGVASGLAALHARGIVHRDLKPSNVLLENGEHPIARIADFGIARLDPKASPFAATADASNERSKLTATGALVGTPLYMAPENVKGAVGPPADIFALGVIACELLTGAYPFSVPPVIQALAAPPARPRLERLPAFHASWIARALDPDPALRPDAAAIVTLLSQAAA